MPVNLRVYNGGQGTAVGHSDSTGYLDTDLQALLSGAAVSPDPVGSAEARAFVRAEHVAPLVNYACGRNAIISVRNTGSLSLTRIGEGKACKPHAILEKSLKSSALKKEREKLERLLTFVGRPTRPTGHLLLFGPRACDPVSPNLSTHPRTDFSHGVEAGAKYRIGSLTTIQEALQSSGFFPDRFADATDNTAPPDTPDPRWAGLVGWWWTLTYITHQFDALRTYANRDFTVNGQTRKGKDLGDWTFSWDDDHNIVAAAFSVSIPMGILHIGPTPIAERGVGMLFSNIPNAAAVPPDAFTGDYDLHDLIRLDVAGNPYQPAVTPDPLAAPVHRGPTALPTTAVPPLLPPRTRLVDELEELRAHYLYRQRAGGFADTYARLIQHGPQNLYRAFRRQQREAANQALATGIRQLTARMPARPAGPGAPGRRAPGRPLPPVNTARQELEAAQQQLMREYRGAIEDLVHQDPLVAALYDPDEGSVVAFAPPTAPAGNPRVFVMRNLDQLIQFYGDVGLHALNDPFTRGKGLEKDVKAHLSLPMRTFWAAEKAAGNTRDKFGFGSPASRGQPWMRLTNAFQAGNQPPDVTVGRRAALPGWKREQAMWTSSPAEGSHRQIIGSKS